MKREFDNGADSNVEYASIPIGLPRHGSSAR